MLNDFIVQGVTNASKFVTPCIIVCNNRHIEFAYRASYNYINRSFIKK